MKRILLLLLWIITFPEVSAQQSYQYFYSQAMEARKASDYTKYYEMIVKANELHPYNQTILYHRGIASALTSKPKEAILYLKNAIRVNSYYKLDIAELASITNEPEFETLKKFQLELQTSVIKSDTAFLIRDRTLHPETVAAGEKPGVFYISSIHNRKIVRTDLKGNLTDFTSEGQDGLTSVLGLKVDANRKTLWTCSSPMQEMKNYDSLSTSSVYQYDLASKKLLNKYSQPTAAKGCVFGDLILNKKGEVFISDSPNNTIYKVNESTKTLEPFFHSDEFWNIQGIAFSADEKYLFISDYIKGLFRLEVQSKQLQAIANMIDASLKSIDGLLWYNNSLIAIQNGVAPMRVSRYYLNKSLDAIVSYEIIDRGHPAFNEPTNGCIINNTLYYIANSQWSGYDDNHQLKPEDQLQDVVILKSDLRKKP